MTSLPEVLTPRQSTEADAASLELITESLRSQKQWQKLQDSCAEEARGAQARADDELERLQAKFVKLEAVFNRLMRAASSGGDMENLVDLVKRVSGVSEANADGYTDEEIAQWRKRWENWHAWQKQHGPGAEGLAPTEYRGNRDDHVIARHKALFAEVAKAQDWSDEQVAKTLEEGDIEVWLEELALASSSAAHIDNMYRIAEAHKAVGYTDEQVAIWRKPWENWLSQSLEHLAASSGADMDRVVEAARAQGYSDEEIAVWRKQWEDWHAWHAQYGPDALDVDDEGRPAVVVEGRLAADETDADTVATEDSEFTERRRGELDTMHSQSAAARLRDERARLQRELRTLRGHELAGLTAEELSKLEADVTAAARRIARYKEKRLRAALRVPDAYVCPITRELMHDPVFASDGHTYERDAIQQWLISHDTSPKTGLILDSKHLVPNFAIRSAIDELKARNDNAPDESPAAQKQGERA